MADEADQSSDEIESSLNRVIEATRRGKHLLRTGRCHNCDEPVGPDALFCDQYCSEDWHARQKAQRRQRGGHA